MDIAAERAYSTPVSNSTLLPLLLLSLARQRHTPEPSDIFKHEYDYIVVGAGAGGSVVASRLSEYPCVNVLLLEAGHKPPLLTEVPALAKFFGGSDVDWKFKTVPQKYTGAGLKNRQMSYGSGKMLGGSTNINGMVYVRGNMRNYDEWENMGATGWSYNDVYPYFLKLEDNQTPDFASDGYHSFGGPITVEQPRYNPNLKKAVLDAALSLGYEILDSNAAKQTGFYDHQSNTRDNQRCSTAKAYLVPAENRTNLDIVANAFVTKVLIDRGKANGVQFDFQGETHRVMAKREVILSAGAINTPKLLKLSGVGPTEELLRLDIPVMADLPVGYNLMNHISIKYPFILNPSEPGVDEKLSDPRNIDQYIENRTGPLCSTDGWLVTSFLKGLEIRPLDDFPNYSLLIAETPTSLIKKSGLKSEVYEQFYGPYENRAIFNCVILQLQPHSTGTVKLQSTNPYVPPLIDPKCLSDPRDIEDIVQGLKSCKRLIATDAMRQLGACPLETLVPGCEQYASDDDKYFRCLARVILETARHPTSTSKMGNFFDPTTVVDPELRVKFIRNLRVVDASVMPKVPSGNTNIPTIMIAEKAADMIKKTIKCFPKKSPIYRKSDQMCSSQEYGG